MRFIFLSLVLCFSLTSAIIAEVDNNISRSVTNANIIKNGEIIPAEYFDGHVLVFYFFGDDMDSWIRPINILNYLTKEFAGKNVKIGGFTTKSKEQIEKQMKKIDFVEFVRTIDFPIITKTKTVGLLNIKTPCVYVAGLDGKVQKQGQLNKNLDKTIAGLLNEKAPSAVEKNKNSSRKNLVANLNGYLIRFDTSVPPPPPGEIMGGIPVPRIDRDIQGISDRRKQEKEEKPKILDTKQRKSYLPPARNNSLYDK